MHTKTKEFIPQKKKRKKKDKDKGKDEKQVCGYQNIGGGPWSQ